MRILIQRVTRAKVSKVTASEIKNDNHEETQYIIGKGLLLFVGFGKGDKEEVADYFAKKIHLLRIFENKGKFDLSLADIKGEVLVIPQFTLYGNADKGRRPEFIAAESHARSKELFDYFYDCLNKLIPCKKGFFGEKMKVELVNDGPVTLLLER